MKAHFVGIGGIGMSALARYFLSRGVLVSGSDAGDSDILRDLEKEGVTLFRQHKKENVPSDIYQLVYSEAIPEENPEREVARERGVLQKSYFAALGDISSSKRTISICGTHGKSTTTAMAGLAFEAAGTDPLVILGTKVFEWEERNIRIPTADPLCFPSEERFFLVESCEYHESFLHISPSVIVVTNIEPDHLDFFGSPERYYAAFRDFSNRLPKNGTLIANFSDSTISSLFQDFSGTRVNTATFLSKVPLLSVPGEHNRANAAAVLALTDTLGIRPDAIRSALSQFRGTWRRFQKKGISTLGVVYDDYAHHPTEIRATLRALRERYPTQKIWAIFEPHQYSRTRDFLNEFSQSFSEADQVLIPDIYRVRDTEEDVASVNAEMLVKKIRQQGVSVRYSKDFSHTVSLLHHESHPEDVIITMGAGPVYKIADQLISDFSS
ncbi:UDP-N-acetylmuramate--L-alanine ligase [Candidatus Peregrinibacteria bacterium]|nr:MAG: UDP-N-acetylmuramate--L-alanine ligase [Candidatus Peregrinibacteria bacterium]